MSFDFSNLTVQADDTLEFEVRDVVWSDGTSPVLIMRPATEANKSYTNAGKKIRSKIVDAAARGRTLGTEMRDQMRESDAKTFPTHVLVGWKNMKDCNDHAREVPFSVNAAEEFCQAMYRQAPEVWDEITQAPKDWRAFASTEDDISTDEAEEVAGN